MHRHDEEILVLDDGEAAATWFSDAVGDRRTRQPLRPERRFGNWCWFASRDRSATNAPARPL